jgi:hypothetical protein
VIGRKVLVGCWLGWTIPEERWKEACGRLCDRRRANHDLEQGRMGAQWLQKVPCAYSKQCSCMEASEYQRQQIDISKCAQSRYKLMALISFRRSDGAISGLTSVGQRDVRLCLKYERLSSISCAHHLSRAFWQPGEIFPHCTLPLLIEFSAIGSFSQLYTFHVESTYGAVPRNKLSNSIDLGSTRTRILDQNIWRIGGVFPLF